ncbi:MAG: hypothetical protein JW950_14300, partial [Deltaproteobacteria bacterium]|nr:hypothetical protein [Deltaproteobacteria bacterium]
LGPILDLVTIGAELYTATELPMPLCSDPCDDTFLVCAIAGSSKMIVSEDKHLLKVSGCRDIEIQKSREFVIKYLQKSEEAISDRFTGKKYRV